MPEVERSFLGTDHCEIGYLMTRNWNMPETIQIAIRDHHSENADTPPESLTGILQIAEYLTNQLNYDTIRGVIQKLPQHLFRHIQENIDEYQVLLDDLPEEMSKARDIYGSEGN